MRTPDRILTALYDRREGFVSVEDLAAAAGVGGARLDRELEALREAGCCIEFSPQEGVRLLPPAPLAACLIERDLGTARVGRSVVCFDVVESTNDVALAAIRQGGADGLVVLAESQTRGRGRLGRTWVSPARRNVLLSALLVDIGLKRGRRHEALTIAAGLAAAEAIEESTGLPCELKWPNDVLLAGAKVAGILVEMRAEGQSLGTVLGIGVNVNAAPPAEEVDRPVTCLADRLSHEVDRVAVVRALLRRLDEWVRRTDADELEELHRGFLARCHMINERVTILCDGQHHTGRVLDVDPLRGLVLCHDDGTRAYLRAEGSSVA
jgi:BirA family biotin operon repressor/biotin-[acetyl-CoA-carboxylase] ligase